MPMSEAPARNEPSASDHRGLPAIVPAAGAESPGFLSRVMHILFGWKATPKRADLEVVLAAPPAESGFSPEEAAMLKNILGLRDYRFDRVMVPRADIVAVQQDIQLGELIRVFEGAAHSRLVVFNDTLDDPIGMVHIRDLIAYMTARALVDPEKNAKRKKPLPAGLDLKSINLATPLSAARIVREILFVPPSMRAIDLLARMQASRIHLALIIDEYGGTDGLCSIEDIVEQIVGEISDEHDEEEAADVVQQPDGSYIADARAKLEDVTAIVGHDLDLSDAADEVDTLGGYLVTRAGRLPLRGELIPGPGLFEFEVLDADPRRIKRVRILRLKERRDRPREARRRSDGDGLAAASTVPSAPGEAASAKDSGSSESVRRP
jgi:CBS domain containing-hemolysin-like protein